MHLLPDCNNAHASSAPKVKPQLEVELFHPTKKKPLSYLVCGFYPPHPSTSQHQSACSLESPSLHMSLFQPDFFTGILRGKYTQVITQ